MTLSPNTITSEEVPYCTCAPAELDSRSDSTKFSQCPMPYTQAPYPPWCIHSTHLGRWVPPPRLVGVETNPGPKGRGKKQPQTKPVVAVVVATRKPRARAPRPSGGRPLQLMLKSALNPLANLPPNLGFGDFVGMGSETLFSRTYAVPNPASTAACVIFNPSTAVGPYGGKFGAATQGYLRVTGHATSDTKVGADVVAGTSIDQFIAPQNRALFIAQSELWRPITAAVRVVVRYPATSTPGQLFAFTTLESDLVIGNLTYTQLAALNQATVETTSNSGVMRIQCNWRQQSPAAFDLADISYSPNANIAMSKCVVVALGWPPGFTFDVHAVSHVEYNAGVQLQSTAVADSSNSLALANVSQEQLAAALRKVPSVLTDDMIRLCQMDALTAAVQRHTLWGAANARQRTRAVRQSEEDGEDLGATVSNFGLADVLPSMDSTLRFASAAARAYAQHRRDANGSLIAL